MTEILFTLTCATWLLTGAMILRFLGRSSASAYGTLTDKHNLSWLLALTLHGAYLLLPLWSDDPVLSVSFFNSINLIMWLTSLLLFSSQLKRPLTILGLILIPITLSMLILEMAIGSPEHYIYLSTNLGLHVILSLLAYSLLGFAALQALVLAFQHYHLRHHRPGGMIRTLPPLQDMEAFLFRLISAGVILLTLGLILGLTSVENLFGQGVAHKIILSLSAWGIFSILLFGHWKYGWRGKIAIRWTLGGFSLLMLGFLGSKFVLEYLVNYT